MTPGTRRSDTREVLDALRRIVQFARVSAASTRGELGISAAQLFVLQTLANADGLSVKETAARVHTDQSSVSVVVKRLVEKRLVARKRSSRDARRVELTATSKGRALIARKIAAPGEGLLRGIEAMRPASRRNLARSLAELLRGMGLEGAPASLIGDDDPRSGLRRRR